MKITFDAVPLGKPYGNSVYTTELLRAFLRLYPQHEYQIMTWWRKKRQCCEAFEHAERINVLNSMPHPLILGRLFRDQVLSINGIIQRFAVNKGDVFHCTNMAAYLPNLKGIKNMAVTVHDLVSLHEENWTSDEQRRFYKKNAGQILQDAKIIFADSLNTKADIAAFFPYVQSKVIHVPLAIDSRFKKVQVEKEFLQQHGYSQSDKPFLLYVGALLQQPRKNVPRLLKGFSLLSKDIRSQINLVLVGNASKPQFREALNAAVRENGLEGKVFVVSNLSTEALVKFYNAATGFVYLSLYEGFGLPVLEAMQCGCPAVTSNCSSLPEVGGEAVLYADPYNPESICKQLELLLTDETLRQELSAKGLQRAKQFTWEHTASLTMDGYKKMLE